MNIDLSGEVAVVTGGGGVLCSAISRALAGAGARVAVLDFRLEAAEAVAREIERVGGSAFALRADVLDSRSLEDAAHRVEETIGQVSILVNGAGGNKKEATTSAELSFFDLPREAIEWVFQLNFLGTFLPSQVFGKRMAARKRGNILNIASMNAFRPLTKIPAYSAAKAAVTNFTQWLAVHLARTCSSEIRVNALLPDRSESIPPDRCLRNPDGTWPPDHRSHAHGTLRRPRGSPRHGPLARLEALGVRHRRDDPGRRRLRGVLGRLNP
jgi:NAD(P)-dependent dehydrogenase (short-subunit alcohol dehydrogenase family)